MEAVCRGSYALGSACGRCVKCAAERDRLADVASIGAPTDKAALEVWPADVPGAPPFKVAAQSPVDAAIEAVGGLIKSGAPIAASAGEVDDYLVRDGFGNLVRVRCKIMPGVVMFGQLRTCRRCGCVEDRACKGGCSWVENSLCSKCVEAVN